MTKSLDLMTIKSTSQENPYEIRALCLWSYGVIILSVSVLSGDATIQGLLLTSRQILIKQKV